MKKNFIIIAGIIIVLFAVVFSVKHINSSSSDKNESVVNEQPQENFSAMLEKADALVKEGKLLEAQQAYRQIMSAFASKQGIEAVQNTLEDLNMRILFSGIEVPGKTVFYEVKPGDSLAKIARAYSTTVGFLKKENGLSSDLIRPGMRLRIWTDKFSVVVDKSQNTLMLNSGDDVLKVYGVSTGRDNITPVGEFTIVNKLMNPPWTHDGRIIPPESPENILGTRWLGFDLPGYGIHGTTEPESIGKQVTAGCVRMRNNEVEELYDLLPVGTQVQIVD